MVAPQNGRVDKPTPSKICRAVNRLNSYKTNPIRKFVNDG